MIPTRFETHGAWKKAATQQGARRFDGDAMFDVAHAPDGNVMGEWNGSNGIGWVSGHFVGQSKASRRLLRAGIPDGSVGYPNPTTTDEKLRIAIGRLGDMAIGMADEEWDSDHVGMLASKAIDLGLATTKHGVFRSIPATKRFIPSSNSGRVGLGVLSILSGSDEWDSDVIGMLLDVIKAEAPSTSTNPARVDNWFFIDSDAMKIHTQGRADRPARSYSFKNANEFRKAIKRLKDDGYKFIKDQAPSTSTNPARRLNHLSERVFQTYSGWRRAAIELGATRFEGDKDIAHAFTEDDDGRSLAIGEWDGETGTVRELALVPGRDVKHNPAYRGRLSPRVLGLLRDAMIAATPHVDNLVGIITNDPRVKDKAMRLRWDMLWTGQRLARNDAMREVYAEGANDDHIDTALRQIARELNVPWQGATTGNPVGRGERPLYVEFVRLRPGEDPFEMKGTKWQFVTARYPDGRLDIGVYSFAGDLVYSYDSWRRMHNIQGAASEHNPAEDEA